MGYGDHKINAAPVRNYRRTRASRRREAHVRASVIPSGAARARRPSRDPRLFEGFRSFRRGFNERMIESGFSRSPCLSTFSAADKYRPLKIFIAPPDVDRQKQIEESLSLSTRAPGSLQLR